MFDNTSLALAALVLCFASCVQGFCGFGMNLLAVGALSYLANIHSVVPLCIMLSCTTSWLLLVQNLRFLRPRLLIRVIVPALAGVPIGVLVLSRLDSTWILRLLGVTLLVISATHIVRKKAAAASPAPWKSTTAGFLGGLLGGAFGTSGPPLAVFFHFTVDSHVARTSLYAMFGVIGLTSIFGHFLAGNANSAVIKMGIILLPVVILGSKLGDILASRTDPTRYKRVVAVLLAMLGLSLLAR